MKRVNNQMKGSRALANTALFWIIHAKRPLTSIELQHALAVRDGALKLNEKFVLEVEDLVSDCAGLITVDEESDIIRLVHYTTQEYFKRTWISWFPTAQQDIVMTCLMYLSFNAFETGFCPTDEKFKTRLRLNPLYNYAERNWGHHLNAVETNVHHSILKFRENGAKVSSSSQAMMVSNEYHFPYYSQIVPRQITGVHLAAYFGLRETTLALLKNGHRPDIKDSESRTPLSRAVENGHEAVVRLLLARTDVEVNSKDAGSSTPLWWAATNGHEAVIRLLLTRADIEVNSTNELGWTPLSWAAANGHEAVVKLLQAHNSQSS